MLRLSILLVAGTAALAQQYTISTVAGGAPPATPAPAAGTSIGVPHRVMVAGNSVYFSAGNSVYRMDSSGSMVLVAGNSRAGFSGDGGPAVNAKLNSPQGMALDSAGNLYIADSLNNRVRKVDPNGIITTYAGDGNVSQPGFWGDGSPATAAQIHAPVAIAIDKNGLVYIVTAADNTIRLVDVNGNIAIFAGEGYKGFYGDAGPAPKAGITGPQDMTFLSDGSALIADTGNGTIRKVTTDGNIATVSGNGSVGLSGDGTATGLAMLSPFGVVADSSGNIYVAEFGTERIRKIDSSGNITTAIGNGSLGFAGDGGAPNKVEMNGPTGVALDGSGNLFFVDSLNYRIRKLTGGNVATVAGNGILAYSGNGGAAISAQLNTPLGVAADSTGNLYISDTLNNVVRKIDAKGVITAFAGNGSPGNGGDNGAATSAQLNGPQGLAVDASGNLYIADTQNNRIRKVSGATITTIAGANNELGLPFGIALDSAGNIYAAEFGRNRVSKISPAGAVSTIAGNGVAGYGGDGGPAASAMLSTPQGVAVDTAGNVYIADTGNNRVRVVSGGIIGTFAGNGIGGYDRDGVAATATPVGNPVALAADSSGALYIADGSARVRKVLPNGLITTIAGSGSRGYSGDGGSATNAMLSSPSALALAPNGAVLVADTYNNAVRLLQPSASSMSLNAITSGASNLAGAIAPGEVVVLWGAGLGPSPLAQYQLGSNGLVPTSVAGTSVYFGSLSAPVLYTSSNQVAAIVPFGVSGAQVPVLVSYNGQFSSALSAAIATAVPAIFTLNGSGAGQAAAINQDGSVNGASKPAKSGAYISLWITGAGQTNPPGADGQPGTGPSGGPVLPVAATIGGKSATVQYAGSAQGLVAGVIQVNLQVPSGVSAGAAVPVAVQIGSNTTQPNVTIAVSN